MNFGAQITGQVEAQEPECRVIRIEGLVVGELGHAVTAAWCHLMKHCSASQ